MNSRTKLILVFTFFLGPVAAAFIWYYGLGASFVPRDTVNNAPLLSPVVVLENFSNPGAEGGTLDLDTVRGQWTVVHVLGDSCDETCQRALYNTRQTRLALGRRSTRVQRLLISSSSPLLAQLGPDHPDAQRLLPDQNGLERQLGPLLQGEQAADHDALLVDPLGNVMMRIPADLDPTLLLKDLKRLLKVSRIG